MRKYLLLLLLLVSCQPQDMLEIGLITVTSGPAAFLGLPHVKGAELAVEEINRQGGINGRQVKLVVAGSPCDPKSALTAYTRLATANSAEYIIGPACSFEGMAVAPLAEEYQVPTIALGAQKELAIQGDYTIAFNHNPALQGELLGEYALAQGFVHAGAIYFLAPYTQQLANGMRDTVQAGGGEFVLQEEITDFARADFKDVLTKAIARNIDILYVEPYGQEELFLRQATELGYEGIIALGENGFRPEIAESPLAQGKVVALYHEGNFSKFNTSQPFSAALAYDAVHAIAQSIEEGASPAEMRAWLMENGFSGAAGDLRYLNGQPTRTLQIYEVKGKAFILG